MKRRPLSVVRRFIAILLIFPVTILLSGFQVFGHQMIGGVNGRDYWLDGSINGPLASEIHSSKWLWGSTTNAVAWSETPTKLGSEAEYYQSSQNLFYCARVFFYVQGSVRVDPHTQDWVWAKVLIANEYNSSISCPNRRGILVHELGHVMGLAHSGTGATAIMRADISALSWEAPKQDDVNGIHWLY